MANAGPNTNGSQVSCWAVLCMTYQLLGRVRAIIRSQRQPSGTSLCWLLPVYSPTATPQGLAWCTQDASVLCLSSSVHRAGPLQLLPPHVPLDAPTFVCVLQFFITLAPTPWLDGEQRPLPVVLRCQPGSSP